MWHWTIQHFKWVSLPLGKLSSEPTYWKKGMVAVGKFSLDQRCSKTNIFQVRVWQSIVWSYYSQRFWQIAQQLQVSPWCCCCSFTVICSQVHQMRKADIKEGVTWTQVTDSGHSVSVWGQIACSQSVAWLLEWEELIVGHILHQRAPQTSWLSASQGWRKHVLLWIHKEVYPTERHQNKIQLYCDWQIRLSETTKTGS